MLRNVPIDINIRNTKNVEGDIIKVEMPSAYDEVLGYPEFGMFGEFGDRLYPELKSGNITVGGSKNATDTVENQLKENATQTGDAEKMNGDNVEPIKKEETESKILKVTPGLALPLDNPLKSPSLAFNSTSYKPVPVLSTISM